MIHPSYAELMDVVNKSDKTGDSPVVNSRYSIVCATAKRARQLIDGAENYIDAPEGSKPLSVAVDELYSRKLKILTEEEAASKEIELIEYRQRQAEVKNREREAEERERQAALKAAEEAENTEDAEA